jgi:hypothetical protein
LKRNASEYDYAGGVSAKDAQDLLTTVQQFAVDAEVWIKANHPALS